MKKKILITSTDVMMLQFLIPHVFYLQENGYEVEVACSNVENHIDEVRKIFSNKVNMYCVDLKRSPNDIKNIYGLKQLTAIIKNGNYDVIWTNEPVMGVMTRLAAKKERKKGLKVIYIAHGFHFFKGARKVNWLLFYPIEKIFSYFTDLIITINDEDYNFAKKNFSKPNIKKYPGIGIDTSKFFKDIDENLISLKRKEIGIKDDEHLIISVGELEKRKNHESSIKAFSKANLSKCKMIICGVGTQENELRKLIKQLNMEEKIFLLGYRYDINELCHISDLFLFTTFQEGLSVALMEAMSVGVPCLISKIRGNVDLIEEGKGIYCDPHDVTSIKKGMEKFFSNPNCFNDAIEYNKVKIKKYDIKKVRKLLLNDINNVIGD